MCIAVSLQNPKLLTAMGGPSDDPLQFDPSWQAALDDETYPTFDVFIDPPTPPPFLSSVSPVMDPLTGRPNRARPWPSISLEIRTQTLERQAGVTGTQQGATLFIRFSWAQYVSIHPETFEEVFQAWVPERFVVPEPLYRLYLRTDGGYIFQFYTADATFTAPIIEN
jgi:hypothetical protein